MSMQPLKFGRQAQDAEQCSALPAGGKGNLLAGRLMASLAAG